MLSSFQGRYSRSMRKPSRQQQEEEGPLMGVNQLGGYNGVGVLRTGDEREVCQKRSGGTWMLDICLLGYAPSKALAQI